MIMKGEVSVLQGLDNNSHKTTCGKKTILNDMRSINSTEELQRVMKGHVQCWFEAEKATLPSRYELGKAFFEYLVL